VHQLAVGIISDGYDVKLFRNRLEDHDDKHEKPGEDTSDFCGRVPRMLSTTGTTCTETVSCDRQR